MKKIVLSIIASFFFLLQAGQLFAQGITCATANVFCTGTNYNFPNVTTNPNGVGQVACLFATPNPVWYYMQISQPGSIGITLSQTSTNGVPLDVDFALWGPFSSLAEACANYSAVPIIDCSYSASHTEHIDIPGSITASGQFYLLLMTNFSQQAGNISFISDQTSTGSTAGTGQLAIASNLPVCPGDSVALIATGGAAGNYFWTTPANQLIIADTLFIPSLQTANSGTYVVTSGNGVCSNMATISVMGGQAPAPTANSPVCNGGTIFLQADAGFTSYSWIGPNGFTSTDQNPVILNADSTKAGQYTVYGQLDGCLSLPGTVQVQVDSTGSLQVNAAVVAPLNQGNTLFLNATGSNATYHWTGPNGFAATGPSTYIQQVSPANAGLYTVWVEAAGCTGDTAQTSVTINPLNQISGTVFSDDNNNSAQDAGEIPLSGKLIKFLPGGQFAISNSLGAYSAFVTDTTYQVSVQGLSTYQSANPASHTATVSGSSQVVSGKDFGIYGLHVTDVQVTLIEALPAIPGFGTLHQINYSNPGTLPVSGTVRYKPDPALQLAANTSAGYTLAGDTLVWSFSNLLPGQVASLFVYQAVPVGTVLGTALNSTALVTPLTGDADSLNNYASLPQVVVGSWDPNDKAVIPAGPITLQDIAAGLDLEYTIRFQNTGTAPAVNVLVADTLSSNLDLSTFQMLSSSHSYNLTLRGNGILEWHFPNIMLPDSNANEPASHGNIKYRIKPKSTLAVGDVITNTAYIYFDFNEAVITNTTLTPVGILALEEVRETAILAVFPNPNSGSFTVQLSQAKPGPVQVEVLNMLGQTVYTQTAMASSGIFLEQVSAGTLPAGMYVVNVQQEGKSHTQRLVLQR